MRRTGHFYRRQDHWAEIAARSSSGHMNQKKSTQPEENYTSTWIYWDKLQFSLPVKAGKSKDSLKASVDQQSNASPDTSLIEEDAQKDTKNQENEFQTPQAKLPKRRTEQELASKKHVLLDRCLDVLKEPMQSQNQMQCHFSL